MCLWKAGKQNMRSKHHTLKLSCVSASERRQIDHGSRLSAARHINLSRNVSILSRTSIFCYAFVSRCHPYIHQAWKELPSPSWKEPSSSGAICVFHFHLVVLSAKILTAAISRAHGFGILKACRPEVSDPGAQLTKVHISFLLLERRLHFGVRFEWTNFDSGETCTGRVSKMPCISWGNGSNPFAGVSLFGSGSGATTSTFASPATGSARPRRRVHLCVEESTYWTI